MNNQPIKPFLRDVFSLLPFGVGSFIQDFLSKTDTQAGTMSREKLIFYIIKFCIYAFLLYSGVINFAQFNLI